MPQRQASRSNSEDDDDLESQIVAVVSQEGGHDSGYESAGDDLLEEIDKVIEDAVIYEQFVQKGGQ